VAGNPADEMVDVIDESGNVVGVVSRREIREQRLPHRCTYVLVFNSKGELFVHQRTPMKDVFPSYWDVCVGGVLASGESFNESARREVREEIGITVIPEPLFLFRYSDERTIVQGMVYRVTHDGPFILQPEEVVRGQFVPLAAMSQLTATEPFCPDGLAVLREYLRRKGSEN